MVRSESTYDLIEEFLRNPGAEAEDFEVKSKQKIDSKGGRQELAKNISAMANTAGGTFIIGVTKDVEFRGQDFGDSINNFDPNTEIKQTLYSTCRKNTDPKLDRWIEIEFKEVLGKNVLRVDVKKSNRIVFFRKGSDQVAYKRSGDSKEKMSQREVAEKSRNLSGGQRNEVWCSERLDWDAAAVPDDSFFNYDNERCLTRTQEDISIVPGDGYYIDFGYGGNQVYELIERFNAKNVDSVKDALRKAEEILNISKRDFFYSFMGEGYQQHGKGVQSFLNDLSNWDRRGAEIEEELGVETSHYTHAVAGCSTRYGPFVISLQTRDKFKTFKSGKLGVIMYSIPFDDEDLKKFFNSIGSSPLFYKEVNGVQNASVRCACELSNVEPLRYDGNSDDGLYFVTADNPFYGRENVLKEKTDVPSHLASAIASCERLPMRIQGGSKGFETEKAFYFRNLEVTSVSYATIGTCLMTVQCSAEGKEEYYS
jgi:hypothetical protein